MTSQAQLNARFMELALSLARRSLGRTWPNPAVGCVLTVVAGNGAPRIVGRGWTQPGGRPHAETQALAQAGDAARGATAYVSLEPCAHEGETPPCTQALIAAGIARAVVACTDPDPRVCGKGVAALQKSGIEVELGVKAANAGALNQGFFSRIRRGRPLVTLKFATSVDGKITDGTGRSQWISSPRALDWGHGIRACYDAVLVGAGTARRDDPQLTCRLPGMAAFSPVPVLLDSHLRTPRTARIFGRPAWLVTGDDVAARRLSPYRRAGVSLITVPREAEGFLDLGAVLAALAERGLTRVLVEGGALATALLASDCVDRIIWLHAPRLFGAGGGGAVGPFDGDGLADSPRFKRAWVREIDQDMCSVYVRCDPEGPEPDAPVPPAYLI